MALSLGSASAVFKRIAHAHDVVFGTYVLRPDSGAQRALLAAAHAGARVRVTLQRDPYNIRDGTALNAASTHALREAGARVRLLDLGDKAFHLKASVCDGIAYLDDRNWATGPQIVVADDQPRDVALVRAALLARATASNRTLALRKDIALARETSLVRHAGDAPVIVETENVGASPLADALCRHAARGARTVLILGDWRNHPYAERAAIERLKRAGVEVLETGTNEKLALAGNRAWIGSANATGPYDARTAGQFEWGAVTRVKALVNAVAAALRRDGAPASVVRSSVRRR
ncbi:MAG: PLD-like domain [Candidatus Eremiobacteraeota bacterium]|nr:PLD-like domain [Candidatus Eremiobacteraeota bacterium]